MSNTFDSCRTDQTILVKDTLPPVLYLNGSTGIENAVEPVVEGHMRSSSDSFVLKHLKPITSSVESVESPTIIKSKSLTRKIREHQGRERTIPLDMVQIEGKISGSCTKQVSLVDGTMGTVLDENTNSSANSSIPPQRATVSNITNTPTRHKPSHLSDYSAFEATHGKDSLTKGLPAMSTTLHSNGDSTGQFENGKGKLVELGHFEPPSIRLSPVVSGKDSNKPGVMNGSTISGSTVLVSVSNIPALQPLSVQANRSQSNGIPVFLERGSSNVSKTLDKIGPSETSGAPSGGARPKGTHIAANSTTKLHSISQSPQISKSKSAASNSLAPIIVEKTFAVSLEAAAKMISPSEENDTILQQRLLQAKSLNRSTVENGAVMHKFSLWSKANAQSKVTESVSSDNSGKQDEIWEPVESSESGSNGTASKVSKIRGPRAAISKSEAEDPNTMCVGARELEESSFGGYTSAPRAIFPARTETRSRMNSVDVTEVKTKQQPVTQGELIVDVIVGSEGQNDDDEDDYTIAFDTSIDMSDKAQESVLGKSGGLASTLRQIVVGAHIATPSENSPIETANTAQVVPPVSSTNNSNTVIVTVENKLDTTSGGWGSDDEILEDEACARVGTENDELNGRFVVEKLFSQSGPARISSDMVSFGKPYVKPFDAVERLDIGSHSIGSLPSNMMESLSERTTLRRSTTSGDPREVINQTLGRVSPVKGMTVRSASECNIIPPNEAEVQLAQNKSSRTGGASKYQILKNLKSSRSIQIESQNFEFNVDVDTSAASKVEENTGGTHEEAEQSYRDSTPSPNLSEVSDNEEKPNNNNSLRAKSTDPNVLNQSADVADNENADGSPLRWRKGEMIGEGTFGKVYKGMNEKTGELLAIKQFYLSDGSRTEVEALQREISVMWSLQHENIVRYIGTSRSERYLFIMLEYVTGGSIASIIAQFGPLSEKLIARFTSHILCGVEYLHSKGIIHRDIKGANILVTDTGIAKLADFGCSKQLVGMFTASMEESLRTIRGSVPWMAPEVVKQSGHGRSSDIWSVGATIIEMATGKPPWPDFNNNLATMFHLATSKEPPRPPEGVSAACSDFLCRCLVIEPSDRATAQELRCSDFLQQLT